MIYCCWSSQWFGEDVGVKASDWFRTQSHLIYFDIHDWKNSFLKNVFNRTRNIEYFPKTIAPFPATPMYVFAGGRDLTWRATMVGGVKETLHSSAFASSIFFFYCGNVAELWSDQPTTASRNVGGGARKGRGQSPPPPCRSSFCRRRRCDNGDLHWPDIPMHTY